MPRARRLRGALLRVMLNRRLVIAVGVVLASPGFVLVANDYSWETGVTDGLALLALATGVALVWIGVTGRQPDWIDES